MFISRLNSLEMKNLFYYVFYRASKFYEDWGEKNGHIAGGVVVFMSIGSIVLSIMIFVLYHLFNEKISTHIIWIIIIITSILSLFLNRKKHEELVEKYKNEENSQLKGWFVFSYVVGSVILFFVSMLVCGYWVDVRI